MHSLQNFCTFISFPFNLICGMSWMDLDYCTVECVNAQGFLISHLKPWCHETLTGSELINNPRNQNLLQYYFVFVFFFHCRVSEGFNNHLKNAICMLRGCTVHEKYYIWEDVYDDQFRRKYCYLWIILWDIKLWIISMSYQFVFAKAINIRSVWVWRLGRKNVMHDKKEWIFSLSNII